MIADRMRLYIGGGFVLPLVLTLSACAAETSEPSLVGTPARLEDYEAQPQQDPFSLVWAYCGSDDVSNPADWASDCRPKTWIYFESTKPETQRLIPLQYRELWPVNVALNLEAEGTYTFWASVPRNQPLQTDGNYSWLWVRASAFFFDVGTRQFRLSNFEGAPIRDGAIVDAEYEYNNEAFVGGRF